MLNFKYKFNLAINPNKYDRILIFPSFVVLLFCIIFHLNFEF